MSLEIDSRRERIRTEFDYIIFLRATLRRLDVVKSDIWSGFKGFNSFIEKYGKEVLK